MTDASKIKFPDLEQFEPDLFWQQHGRKIIWGTVAVLAIGVLAYLWQQQRLQELERGFGKLAQAGDVATLQQLAQQYGGSEVGAAALLRLADAHFREGRYLEAAAAYQQFLERYPKHVFADSARLGMAALQEDLG
ncbi:MAG: tetratricopeptide repeat protein, partial [Verrucomicrobiae bacterium]|nr:tetratricopeptide repeat protein [Verrucomicrobiae bacterium]